MGAHLRRQRKRHDHFIKQGPRHSIQYYKARRVHPHNLLRRLKRWYAQELSRDVSSLIDEASDDVVKQASLVLGAAVQGSQREHHITIIMGLDDTVQSELMILVQSIMHTTAQAPSCTEDDFHEEDRRASMQEIARLKMRKTQLHLRK